MYNSLSRWSTFAFLAGVLLSCGDDDIINDENRQKTVVQFEMNVKEVDENASVQTVSLKLSKALSTDVVISIKPDDLFAQNINTDPPISSGLISILLLKGQTEGQLRFTPVDNNAKDGTRVMELKLHRLPAAMVAGTNSTLKITVRDDEGVGGAASVANFIPQDITLEETNTTGIDYQVHFSEPVAQDSEIKITLESEKGTYDADYMTVPAAEDAIVTLPVSAGASVVSFKIRPLNNNHITGELQVRMRISETGKQIQKGHVIEQSLTIKDDELSGKPRGYEVTAGSEIIKRFYEYDGKGRIEKVQWQNYTPYLTKGTDTYSYENDRLVRINKRPGYEVLYLWEHDRIVKVESVANGLTASYHDLEYDELGNIGLVTSYHRQNDGTYLKGMWTLYLYFSDGNIYKSLTYQDNIDPEKEPHLLVTKTYDNYLDVPNPYDMVELLPTVKLQTKLATVYRVEETGSGIDVTYYMTYQFREDGLPEKRIAAAPGDTQTAVYYYY